MVASLPCCLRRRQISICLPAKKPSIFGPAVFPQVQLAQGNDAPKRQRGRGLAESGTGMCRGGESDRMSAEPKSRFPATLPPSPKPANRRRASKPPAGTLPGRIREIRTLTPTPLPTGEGLQAARPDCPQDQLTHGNDAAEAAAWPGIGGERHRDVPRRRVRQDVCRAEEPISGHAAALTEASKPQAGTLPGRIREIRTLTPTPLPTGEGLQAARPDCPQDQLAQGNDAPKWQRGRALAEGGTGMCRGGESDRMSAEPKSRAPAAPPPLPTPRNHRQARCLVVFGETVPSPQPLSRRERGLKHPCCHSACSDCQPSAIFGDSRLQRSLRRHRLPYTTRALHQCRSAGTHVVQDGVDGRQEQ